MGQNKPALVDNPAESNSDIPKVATTSTKGKGNLKLKTKAADDPFASDNDDHADTGKTSKNPTAELKRSNDDEDEEKVKSKKKRIT